MARILVINPGSTSTKLALFKGAVPLWSETVSCTKKRLVACPTLLEQLPMRRADVRAVLRKREVNIRELDAVAARGGPFKPLKSGTYRITGALIQDIQNGNVQSDHASNLAALIGYEIAETAGISAFFVDPVSVDEMEPLARYSGLPEIPRRSLVHALNVKAVARKAAAAMNASIRDLNFIVAHLGGGISIAPLRKGRIVDVNNAIEEGPFSPERAGTLPASSLVRLCFGGRVDYRLMQRRIVGQAGLVAYLGTKNLNTIEARISEGDRQAEEVLQAMAYQIAKEIGAMAAVLSGRVDAVVLTGGCAHSDRLCGWIRERVSFIAPVRIFPGEFEMEALAEGVTRVLEGEEEAKVY
ncbi:MAG TPA: butyrate kinase [bacterium]|nr:butyrate kinase [bacterium]